MRRRHSSSRGARRALLLAALALALAPEAHAVGGGSNAVFSLGRSSPTALIFGYSAATLFVDDAGFGPGGPLEIALPPAGLGLTGGANVTALSSGRDDGIIPILAAIGVEPNPMDIAAARYQFSANAAAVDGVTGPVPIPFAGPVTIAHDAPTFPDQFTSIDQAGDVLDNSFQVVARYNFRQVEESYLELIGASAATIDNLDALESLGSFGVTALDDPGDPDVFPEVPVFFAVDALSGGLPTSSVLVKPPGPAPLIVYADAAALGLDPGDDIDALAIWDQSPGGIPRDDPDLVFNDGDGIVFSLAEGSPSLPITVDGVPIDEGGVFLAVPGAGIVAALPGGYFSLADSDELDAVHVVDPRTSPLPPCGAGLGTSTVRPFEGFSVLQSDLVAELGGPPVHVVVRLNETERFGDPSGVGEYLVTATVADPAVARIESAVPAWCGWEPGFPAGTSRCEECADVPSGGAAWTGPCPGPSGTFRAWYIRGLEGSTPPLLGPDLCIGDLHVRAVGPGTTRIDLTGTASGWTPGGPVPKAVESASFWITVTGTAGVGRRAEPARLVLHGPNPFVPNSEVRFEMPAAGSARLVAVDVSGRRVRRLAAGWLEAGAHRVRWDGRDDAGRALASGVYFLRLETAAGSAVRRVSLIP